VDETLVTDWWEGSAPASAIPAEAQATGLSGSCNVTFDVDRNVWPLSMTSQCTDAHLSEALQFAP